MEKNWIKIFSSTNPIKTNIKKQLLSEFKIPVIEINQKDSSYNMFGEINLYIHEKHIKLAGKILSKNE
tara:strand:+ start:14006 stop:14209 length:204 start_codon:yes stop_codon:yes gene_type:complete